MSSSSVQACLVMLCALQIGQSSSTSFTIGDKNFDHVWRTKRNMPGKRSDMTATTVDDAIYLVGGCVLDQIWVNDPNYPEYRCGGVAGNAVTGSMLRYFPKSNSFDESLQSAPRPRYRHAAVAVNKKIYLFGGTGASGSIVDEVDVFDTMAGTWDTLAQRMPNATTDLSAFTHSNEIYILGGYDASWTALKIMHNFKPLLNQNAWQPGPQLIRGRGDAFAAVAGGKAYMVGGFHHENNFASPVADLEMLDLGSASAWVQQNNMGLARGDKAVATLHNVLHVIGGETKNAQGHSVPLRDVEVYDTINNAWHFGGDIPSERFRFVAASHGNSIFIFGGQGFLIGQYGSVGSRYPLQDLVEEYSETVSDVSANMATRGSSMCFGLVFATLATIFKKLCSDCTGS